MDKLEKILRKYLNNGSDRIDVTMVLALIQQCKKDTKEQLILSGVSQQRELLKVFIDTDTDVDLVSGRKCRLLKHTEESFLIQYNHNDQIEWVGISELNTKSL